MLRATLRSLFARKLRLLLSALAVVLGVSFVAGTLVLTDTLNATFNSSFAAQTRNVAVAVRGINHVSTADTDDRALLPAALETALRTKVDGVADAVGQVSGSARLIGPDGKLIQNGTAAPQGINWTGDRPTSTETIADGRAPKATDEIAVDKGTADQARLRVGDHLYVITTGQQTRDPTERFTLVGTFRTGGQDSSSGAMVTAFWTPDAQRLLLTQPDTFTAIFLAAKPGVTQQALAAKVQASGVLPQGVEAITGTALAAGHEDTVKQSLSFLSTMLLIFAGISLFVGAFIIFNTFTMLVAQRVRELALLRALGASRAQVRVSVQAEALLVGVVGSTIGLVAGVSLAHLLHAAMGAFGVILPPGGTVFRARTAVVAYAVGVLVTSAAAVVPAYKAATVPPIAALRDTYTIPARSLRTRAAAGMTGAALGAAMVVYGLSRSGGAGLVGGGAVAIFLGIAALSPVVARPVTRVIGAGLPRLFGVTGRIGLQNAMRNPRRTSATASALMVGLALVSAFAIFGQSIKESVHDTVSNSLRADYFLNTVNTGDKINDSVAQTIAGLPGVAPKGVVPIRGGLITIEGIKGPVSVLAADPQAVASVFALRTTAGKLTLGDGQIAMDDAQASRLHLAVGQPVHVSFGTTGAATLTLAATFTGSSTLVKFLVSTSEWAKHTPSTADAMVLVKRAPGADPATVLAALQKVVEPFPNLLLTDQTGFVAQQEKTVDQLIGLVYVLLALAVIIALFGIVNTLALSVIERTREIGLLRAVGLRRGQMWLVIVLESVVIAMFGATLGVGVGSFLGWALVSALKSQGITTFAYPVTTIVGVLILGGILGVVAALAPALRAARMNVLHAISTT
ncbi:MULTISPECIES: ABC transporter permease [unclassified Frankia]|uniref:ABC transporter permease n=1 Tax=unclassified Frankia TaxID=2632575 RepID=UPI001932BAE0|nr:MULTISPECIES: FtsX-like permease family protein [unclassified Frankia]MBL7491443.1 FtsX-like permease family protein [Frankia sp. AgW1.1]MBL7617962.1 FtsX-like permease family protein [Frankia sp. AgB1.8]